MTQFTRFQIRAVICFCVGSVAIGCASAVHQPTQPAPSGFDQRVTLQLGNTTFATALGALRAKTKLNFFISWRSLAAAGIRPETPMEINLRDAPLSTVLDLMLGELNDPGRRWTYTYLGSGVVQIISLEELESARQTWAYDAEKIANQRVEQALDKLLPPLVLNEVPLREAFSQLSKAANVSINVRWPAIEENEYAKTVTVNFAAISVRNALRAILSQVQLAESRLVFNVIQQQVEVTTADDAQRYTEVRVYDIRDLLPSQKTELTGSKEITCSVADPLEELTKLIQETVKPDTWADAGGSAGRIYCGPIYGQLVISQTPEYHVAIQNLLTALRRSKLRMFAS